MYALDAKTGTMLWSYEIGNHPSSPAIANGIVFVGNCSSNGISNVYALNATTGAKIWISYNTGGGMGSSPVTPSLTIANGVVYVGSTDNVGALDAKTGTMLWSYEIRWSTSPAIANGVVYVGSVLEGRVYAIGNKP